jgi:hypothetical protein
MLIQIYSSFLKQELAYSFTLSYSSFFLNHLEHFVLGGFKRFLALQHVGMFYVMCMYVFS